MAELGRRIEANCRIIWGEGDYDLEEENDNYDVYQCLVRRDFGTEHGPPLAMTTLFDSPDRAWDDLDKMLVAWAEQVQRERSESKAKASANAQVGQSKKTK
ncbi:hypothetical protein MMC10_010151 [Thelotrema lepadinum]|nr:hypothetical protein [Thelotrema lepadinum]